MISSDDIKSSNTIANLSRKPLHLLDLSSQDDTAKTPLYNRNWLTNLIVRHSSDPRLKEYYEDLHVKYPIPADAEGHLDMSTIGEGAAEYSFQAGDMWSDDFDYVGMLTAGSEATYEMGLEHLQKLYDSFEDVNYHTEKA